MISTKTREKWINKKNAILGSLDCGEIVLNEWEMNFMDSIDKVLESENGLISVKQSKVLNRIYEKVK